MRVIDKNIKEKILKFNDFELETFVRYRLGQKNIFHKNLDFKHKEGHLRSDFGGLKPMITGESAFIINNNILMLFKDCGLYDNYLILYMRAYKGGADILYETIKGNSALVEMDVSGYGTVEIIIKVLKELHLSKI